MAYNRENLLKRMIDVQNIVLEHTTNNGSTQEWVFRNIIYPSYKISRATFYSWLGTNAKRELKVLQEAKDQQLQLF